MQYTHLALDRNGLPVETLIALSSRISVFVLFKDIGLVGVVSLLRELLESTQNLFHPYAETRLQGFALFMLSVSCRTAQGDV